MADNFKQLIVWQRAFNLSKQIYLLTKTFPPEEKFGITSQLRRASVSVPSNIAEGNARRSRKDFSRFLNIATGSLAELETQLLLSIEFGYISESDLYKTSELIQETGKLLNGLRRSLE